MNHIRKLPPFLKPYWKRSDLSLILLVGVIMDLAIPRLFQRVINDGEIVERGSHQQLLDAKGFYYNLYLSQFKGMAI